MRNPFVFQERAVRRSCPTLIARIKGGLGNQLFCYAAARRLALANDLELVIDDVTGFARDRTYQRRYGLAPFTIPCRKTTAWERMAPLERGRRAIAKWVARKRSFDARAYVEQEGPGFDPRLLYLKPRQSLYLDGLWQDERYFADIADTLRSDLRLKLSPDPANAAIARHISSCQSVALHMRWFESPAAIRSGRNVGALYYRQAIEKIEADLGSPHYFVFSDDVAAAITTLALPADRFTPVVDNRGEEGAIFDFWLMAQCRHLIMANSTFSWWAAWLGRPHGGSILMPGDVPRMRGACVWDGRKGWIVEPAASAPGADPIDTTNHLGPVQ